MHNPFLENSNQLRKDWKALRSTLSADRDDHEHLSDVARWWSMAPISKSWMDWDHPDKWPDPWELITTKNLDYSAIALGIEYTLLLSNDGRWTSDRVRLLLASDAKKTMQHLVVMVDDRWVLNVAHARVAELDPTDLTFQYRYHYDGKRHSFCSSNMV